MQKRKTVRLTFTSGITLALLGIIFTGATAAFNVTATPAGATVRATAADGAAVYNSKCALCHAKNGAGTASWRAKGQPDLSTAQWQESVSDEQIAAAIRDGKGKNMPAYKKKLSEEEIMAVVKRIRELKK